MKKEIQVSFLYDDERNNYEAIFRGWRDDVIVNFDDSQYKMCVYNTVRLSQDVECAIEWYGFYFTAPYTIIVEETTKECIIETINRLYKDGYFRVAQANGFNKERPEK